MVTYHLGFLRDKLKKSIDYFDKALEIDPNNSDCLSNKASALTWLDKWKEALPCIDRALEVGPETAYSLWIKSIILKNLGYKQDAQEFRDKAYSVSPEAVDHLEQGGALSGSAQSEY